MARDKHEKQIRKTSAQAEELLGEDSILSFVGAPTDKQTGPGPDAELGKHTRDVQHPSLVQFCGVEFQAADHMDRFRTAAQLLKFGSVLFILRAYSGERGE